MNKAGGKFPEEWRDSTEWRWWCLAYPLTYDAKMCEW